MALPRWRWVLYLLPVFFAVLPTAMAKGHIVGGGVDAYGTGWFYWWTKVCVMHFGSPSWTPLFYWPIGKNIFADTGNNLVDALFSVPFQWVFGNAWAAPFTFFLLAGNAWTFEQLAKDLWPPDPAQPRSRYDVVAATAAWTINPYVMLELSVGRPTQALLWWFPLAVLYQRRICKGDRSFRTAAGLGVSVALSAWTYWFAGYFVSFMLLPLTIWWLWPKGSDRIGAVRSIAMGVGVCGALIGPMAMAMAQAWLSGSVSGVKSGGPNGEIVGIWIIEAHANALLTQPAWLLAALTGALVGGRTARTWLAIALGLALVGIGAKFGDTQTLNPVWTAVRYLPFLSREWFPYRVTMVIMLPWTALALHAWQRFGRRALFLLIFLATTLAGENVSSTFPFHHKDATCPKLVLNAAQQPGSFLVLPNSLQSDILLWQTQFSRPLFGGMGESAEELWPKGYSERRKSVYISALTEALSSPNPLRPNPPAERAKLYEIGIRWVVVRRDLVMKDWSAEAGFGTKQALASRQSNTIQRISSMLGRPAAADEKLLLWDVLGKYTDPEFPANTTTLAEIPTFEQDGPPGLGIPRTNPNPH